MTNINNCSLIQAVAYVVASCRRSYEYLADTPDVKKMINLTAFASMLSISQILELRTPIQLLMVNFPPQRLPDVNQIGYTEVSRFILENEGLNTLMTWQTEENFFNFRYFHMKDFNAQR